MFKVGDYIRGAEWFAHEDGFIKPGMIYKVLETNEEGGFRLETGGWWRNDSGAFEFAKCPICGADPGACDDDVELGKKCEIDVTGFCHTHETLKCYVESEQGQAFIEAVAPKHKSLPARALTSWPGLHEKMAVAKLLDELKDD